jgi:CBS domain-containing protein
MVTAMPIAGAQTLKLTDTVEAILRRKGRVVWSLGPEDSVYRAIELMAEKGIGALMVVADGELVGIISERDYARKVILKGRLSKETPIKDIMSTPVLFVSPEHTVSDCMRIMTENRIRHLPVLQGKKVAGMVSIGDLVNCIISAQQETIQQLEAYITGAYPG